MATTYTDKYVNLDAVLFDRKIHGGGTLSDLEVSSSRTGARTDAPENPSATFLSELQIVASFRATMVVDASLPALECSASSDDRSNLDELLPELQIEARFGERVTTGPNAWGENNLPSLGLTAGFGSRMESANLPDLGCAAIGTAPIFVSLVRNELPALECSARTGIRADSEMTLPALLVSVSIDTDRHGTLNKRLTFPALSATISSDSWRSGSLDRDLTFPLITATGFENPIGDLARNLPGLRLSAHAFSGSVGSLGVTDEYLPDLRISAYILSEVIGSVDASLPPITVQDFGSGVGNGSRSAGTLTNRARFDDYILRFSRW
jgi:hypothetical protein